MVSKIKGLFNYKNCLSLALINFIFAVFTDSLFIYRDFKITSIESYFYLVLTNLCFVLFTVLAIKKGKSIPREKYNLKKTVNDHYPLMLVLIAVVIVAVSNFDTTAIYDAHLYYGSFIKGIELCEPTLVTAFGAFINWNHEFIGTALLVAPLEMAMYGEMVGTYIMSTLLLCITIVIFYKMLGELLPQANKWLLALLMAAYAFMPYSVFLITYFCPDYFVGLYLVWLLYAYKKENNLMVSFIGFLMCTTKDPGAFIYGFFLLFAFIFHCLREQKINHFKWWKLKNIPFGKFAMWLIPAAIYAACYFFQDQIQLQEFYGEGSPLSTILASTNSNDFIIQNLQTFVFGFRWIIVGLSVLAFIVYIVKKIEAKRKGVQYKGVVNSQYFSMLFGLAVSMAALDIMLCVFPETHCPRYTSPLNVIFTITLGISLMILSNKNVIRSIISFAIAAIMLVQVYVTYDPSITKVCSRVNTGFHYLYDLCNLKDRTCTEFSKDLIGDVYAYNMEYSLYSDLVRQTLDYINPENEITVYIYDNYYYEMHFAGLQYNIYWDKEHRRQTYAYNENSVIVRNYSVDPNEPVGPYPGYDLYVVVPARRSDADCINRYTSAGYEVADVITASNAYGHMTTYHFRYIGQ